MIHLKLCKGKSYLGAVKATVNKPDVFVEDKKTAERLLKSGYFILVEETTEDEDTPLSRDDKKTEHDFNSLSLDELKQMAEEKGIDITHCRKKADYVAAIEASEKD